MSNSSSKTSERGEAGRLFHDGNLAEAVTAATAAVRKAPTDVAARMLLAEFLLFAGSTDRVDTVLDACAELDPGAAIAVAEFRQLLRGETARRQLFKDGRVPEFIGGPSEAQRLSLAAVVALRSGDFQQSAKLAAEAEQARPHPGGTLRGVAFDDLRDADDLLASSIEVITTTGKYFWIAPDKVASLELHPMKRPRDLFWRRATMQVIGGPEGDIYLPVLYPPGPGEAQPLSDALKLGRATDWRQAGEDGPIRGIGAVTLLVGEEAQTWLEMNDLAFRTAT